MNSGTGDEGGRRPAVVVGSIAALLHLFFFAYATPRALFSRGTPVFQYDYGLHAYQVDRAVRAYRGFGHLWSYDPFVLAGQPAGVTEDFTAKSVEMWVILATSAGIDPWIAYNAYIFALYLALPLVGWVASRLLGLSRLSSALTVLLWVLLWQFDSLLHWFWHVGMLAWAAASYCSVLILALLYRATRDHRASHYVAVGVVTALVTMAHPFVVVTLVVPLAALYARAFRGLRGWEHALLGLGTALTASTALLWIGPAIRFRHYIGEVDAFLWPTLPYVLYDYFELLKDILMTGQPVRTVGRTICLALAVVTFLRWRRSRDDRLLPTALLVATSCVLAYASGYSSVLRQTQPYRNLGPAVLMAALAGAAILPDLLGGGALSRLDRRGKTALAVGLVLTLAPVLRTVLHFLPDFLPERTTALAAFRSGHHPNGTNDELPPIVMGHMAPTADWIAIARHIEQAVPNGRVLVPVDWVLAEYLATFTRVPILGGIPQRNVPHTAAHPLRHDFRPAHEGDDPFGRYVEDYAVAAVVTNGGNDPVDHRPDLFQRAGAFGPYRVYAARREPSYFARGEGRVREQGLNSLKIAGATGPEVVLRFHWLETLACRPRCVVERAPLARDPVGFISVRRPPSEFEIYNDYR